MFNNLLLSQLMSSTYRINVIINGLIESELANSISICVDTDSTQKNIKIEIENNYIIKIMTTEDSWCIFDIYTNSNKPIPTYANKKIQHMDDLLDKIYELINIGKETAQHIDMPIAIPV